MPGNGESICGLNTAKKNPTKSYKEVCGYARETEMLVRTLLYDYSDNIKRFGDREYAN